MLLRGPKVGIKDFFKAYLVSVGAGHRSFLKSPKQRILFCGFLIVINRAHRKFPQWFLKFEKGDNNLILMFKTMYIY